MDATAPPDFPSIYVLHDQQLMMTTGSQTTLLLAIKDFLVFKVDLIPILRYSDVMLSELQGRSDWRRGARGRH